MSTMNYASVSVTQLPIVPSFAAIPSSPLLTLLLGIFLLRLGSPTPMRINMSHLIFQLWLILHPILVMIICILVMVRALTYPILDILRYIPQNAFLHYLMFSMCLILPNSCYLFKNSIMIIMFILNFTLLMFSLHLRDSQPMASSFGSSNPSHFKFVSFWQ